MGSLVVNGLIVTMDEERRIIEDGAVYLEDGKIEDVGRTSKLVDEYARDSEEQIDAKGRIVMPGFISSHTHLYGMALRGASLDTEPPTDFTQNLQRIWWSLDELLTNDDAYATALSAALTYAKHGVTCFADTWSGPNSINGVLDHIEKAVREVGIRGVLAFESTERHSEKEGNEGINENERFIKKAKGQNRSLVEGMVSVHASFTVTDDHIRRAFQVAEELDAPFTIHTAEGLGDVYHNLERYGERTVERFKRLGILGPRTVLAHCVNVSTREVDLIANTNTGVAHNPMSNSLNAVGVAPVPDMLEKGVNVGLGDDGYIFEPFENMRSAFLIHRVHRRDPGAITLQDVLEMATINGAKLYGLDTEIGSIESGKRADLVLIEPKVKPSPINANSVLGHLLYTCNAGDVDAVIVEGEVVLRDGKLVGIDEEKETAKVHKTISRLWDRLRSAEPQIDRVRGH